MLVFPSKKQYGQPENGALLDGEQRLERPVHVVFNSEVFRIQRVERIAAVHRDVEITVVPVERGRLPQPRRGTIGLRTFQLAVALGSGSSRGILNRDACSCKLILRSHLLFLTADRGPICQTKAIANASCGRSH